MTKPVPHTLIHYTDEAGRDLFGAWLETLADVGTRATIAARLLRLELGLFGDGKGLGEGVSEPVLTMGLAGVCTTANRRDGLFYCWRAVTKLRKRAALKPPKSV